MRKWNGPKSEPTYRNGNMTFRCASCGRPGGSHKLACPEWKENLSHRDRKSGIEKLVNQIVKGGDPIEYQSLRQ